MRIRRFPVAFNGPADFSIDLDKPEPPRTKTNVGFQPLPDVKSFVKAKIFGERDKSLTY